LRFKILLSDPIKVIALVVFFWLTSCSLKRGRITGMLCAETRKYLLSTDNGRLLAGNAEAGVRMGLTRAAGMLDFFMSAHDAFVAAGGVNAEDFEDALHGLRVEPFVYGKAQAVLAAGLGFPDENKHNLAGQRLYHVMKLKFLHSLVDRASPLRTDITLPVGTEPKDPDAFLEDWNSLAADERQFSLSTFLGRPIVWFTDSVGANNAERYGVSNGLSRADAFCEVLGLGHHQKDEWLVLLEIPGAAIQAAGHYQPLFCDAITHRYFMAKSSFPARPPSAWGQTANLHALAAGRSHYDGSPERISRQLAPSHFSRADSIQVSLLGPVSRPTYPSGAPKRLSEDVWGRRR
jgi:hypothetical protein